MADVGLIVPLHKTERQGVFVGCVLEPGLEDAHGDVFSKSEIEQTAHRFMVDYALGKAERPDVEHSGRDADAHLLENFCAPCDLTLAGKPVRAGAWVQSWQIDDPQTREEIDRDEITGLSLEGIGTRRMMEAA
jgi:hypothetical protein